MNNAKEDEWSKAIEEYRQKNRRAAINAGVIFVGWVLGQICAGYFQKEPVYPSGEKCTNHFIQTAEIRSDSVYRPSPCVEFYMKDFDGDGKPDLKQIIDSSGSRIIIKKGYESRFGISLTDSL